MPDPLTQPPARTAPAPAGQLLPAVPVARPLDGARAGKEPVALAVLRGVARRWRQVAAFGILAAVAVGAAAWFLIPPPQPVAAAKLYIPQKPPTLLGSEHPDPPLDRQTQVELARSRLVLNAAIRLAEVNTLPILHQTNDEPLDWLAKNLKVEFAGPEIMRVSLSDPDPDQAKTVVDAVVNSYIRDIVDKSTTERAERLKRLKEMAAGQEEALKRKRHTISGLVRGPAGADADRRAFEQRLLQDQMQAAKNQLVRVESDLRAGKLKESIFGADAPVEVPDGVLDKYLDEDKRVRAAGDELKKKEAALEDVRSKAAKPDHPLVVEALAKVAAQQGEIKALRDRLREDLRGQVRSQTKAERAAKLQEIKHENFFLGQQAEQLKAELEAYGQRLADDRVNATEIEPIRFEIKQDEELLGQVRKMINTLTIEQEAPPRVLKLEEAVIARVDPAKRKALMAGGGAAAAFFAVFALIGLLEFRHRRVESPDAIAQGLGLRVVGTVPRPAARPFRWWGDRGVEPSAGRAEAIASTRTMLLHGEGLSAHRVVLITSPVSGEGKTSLSVDLAASVAQSGRRTLLVDGDLRNPSVHDRLGLPAGPGLCEVIRGELSVFDVIQKTPVPGLMLIPAGRWTPETARALVSAPLAPLFATWREQFEFAIFDSSPALPVSDALELARYTDGVILSVLQGVSRVPQAAEACDRFTALGVRVLGVVVNGTPARAYGDNTKYYYGPAADPTPSPTVPA